MLKFIVSVALDLITCLLPSCGWLEKAIPTCEPDISRDLYIQISKPRINPNVRKQKEKVRTHRSRIANGRHRCTAQCRRANVLYDNFFGCFKG